MAVLSFGFFAQFRIDLILSAFLLASSRKIKLLANTLDKTSLFAITGSLNNATIFLDG